MKKILGILLVSILALLALVMPSVRRYLKIERM
jgi:Family of unknown function (DUF6893)